MYVGRDVLVLIDKAGMKLDLKVLLCMVISNGAEVTGLDGLSFQNITILFWAFKTDKPLRIYKQ
jgi:hypothetical protein